MSSPAKFSIKQLVSFERDANTLLVGPTNSGKTTLLKEIINEGSFSGGTPERVYVVVPQETKDDWDSEELKYEINLIVGMEEFESFLDHSDECPANSIVVFDDYMDALNTTKTRQGIEIWFSRVSHHRHLWTFFVTHDMFHKHLTTTRRNTQNFILFDVLQSDYRAAQEFAQRLLGTSSGSAFMSLWQAAVDDRTKGWIRLDQKIHRDATVKTVISMGGITPETVLFATRSDTLTSPMYLDSMAAPNLPNSDRFEIPESLIRRDVGDSAKHSRSVPADGPADDEQSD